MKISNLSTHARRFKAAARKHFPGHPQRQTTRLPGKSRLHGDLIARWCFLLCICASLVGESALARPFRPGLIPNGTVFNCLTCHVTAAGGSARNKFGLDVFAIVRGPSATPFWSPTLAAKDSDGDGFTNGEELGDPDGDGIPIEGAEITNPGNPNSKPAVAVNLPPLIQIITPTNNSVFTPSSVITVDTTATDPDGSVVKVEFFLGTNLVFVATNAPFIHTFTASSVASGNSSCVAQATDNKGAVTRSDPIQITIGELQPVAITSISKSGEVFNIAWSGGIGPFMPQLKASMSDSAWVNGQSTPSREAAITASGDSLFIRIADMAQPSAGPP
jgi:hypothetical protein